METPETKAKATNSADPLDRAVAVAHDIHRSTWDARIFKGRLDRWDIFATRCQSAAESAETFAAFLEGVARRLEVGTLSGDAIARELRTPDARAVVRCFRAESVAVVALLRAEREEEKAARALRDAKHPGPLFGADVHSDTDNDGGPFA